MSKWNRKGWHTLECWRYWTADPERDCACVDVLPQGELFTDAERDVERMARAILASVHYEPDLSRFTLYEDDGPEELAARLIREFVSDTTPPQVPPKVGP